MLSFLIFFNLLIKVGLELAQLLIFAHKDGHRWDEVIINEFEKDKRGFLQSLYSAAKDVVEIVLNVRLQHFFIEVRNADKKGFTHLLKHLNFKLLQATSHRCGLLLNASIEPHGSIFDGLDEHAHDRVSECTSPAECLLYHAAKLDQSAAVQQLCIILVINLHRDVHQHLDHGIHQLGRLQLLTNEILGLWAEQATRNLNG